MRIVAWLGAILERLGRTHPSDISDEQLDELRRAADPPYLDQDYDGWPRL